MKSDVETSRVADPPEIEVTPEMIEAGVDASAQIERNCQKCGKPMTFTLPASGNGERSWECLDCERPDPLDSYRALGWLKGELGQSRGKRSKLRDLAKQRTSR